MSKKELIISLLIIFVVFTVGFWGIVGIPLLDEVSKVSDNTIIPITIDHIDKDGTIWININNNLYYLYINDNGVQKRLEWIK
jgi:hypothetical protein